MGSDRTRISYDPRQQYRSTVMQQGRVTLEADVNEAQEIAAGELRQETLDIIGPSGTPDDGYRILVTGAAPATPFDFAVGPGTLYTGGLRTHFQTQVQYNSQSEWLDHADDPDWIAPAQPAANEFICLLLRNQEVSATEDSALKDVALGGPDTAARTRLIQHIVRTPTAATDCAGGLASAKTKWASEGLKFVDGIAALESQTTLKVTFPPAPPPDPCEPEVQGGYLGADNQLIRIQISGNNRFLWGYDDASFMYRVDVVDPQTLHLQSRPPDAAHQPISGQAIEVLMAAAQLANGEYVAAAGGFVTTLSASYSPDTQQVALQTALPAEYGDGNPAHPKPPRVFMRVWEAEVQFTRGAAVQLGSTGLMVTLDTQGGAPFHVGDFWRIAVRPSTPTQVYPQRYLSGPQPPDGPRLWASALGIIGWSGGVLQLVHDCRNPFDNLPTLTAKKLGGCCTVTVGPQDLAATPLQSVIDQLKSQDQVTICLMPGEYQLPASLMIGPDHSNLTIEACHGGAILKENAGADANFINGLVVIDRAANVTLRGLSFTLPAVRFIPGNGKIANLETAQLQTLVDPRIAEMVASIGVMAVQCDGLTVEDCTFTYSAPPSLVYAAGILARGACTELRIERCVFTGAGEFVTGPAGPSHLLYGFLHSSAATFRTTPVAGRPAPGGTVLLSSLDGAVIEDNEFNGLTAAVMVMADCGDVRAENNAIANCIYGVLLFAMRALPTAIALDTLAPSNDAIALVQNPLVQLLADQSLQYVAALSWGYPMPPNFDWSGAVQVNASRAAFPSRASIAELDSSMRAMTLSAPARSAAAVVGAPPAATVGTPPTETVVTPAATTILSSNTSLLFTNLAALAYQAISSANPAQLALALRIAANEVDAFLSDGTSNTALLVWDYARSTPGELTLDGNHLTSQSATLPTAIILAVNRCAITGNLALNQNTTATNKDAIYSLLLYAGTETPRTGDAFAPVTVTGNVFRGAAILPARPATVPAPLNTWHPFNAEL